MAEWLEPHGSDSGMANHGTEPHRGIVQGLNDRNFGPFGKTNCSLAI